MKKTAALLIAAALLSAACNNIEERDVADAPALIEKTFTAGFPEESRTSLSNDGKVSWTAGDSFSILDGTSNVKVTLTADNISADGRTAVFTASVAQADKYFAVYPYSSNVGIDPSDDDLVNLPGPAATQDGTFSSGHKCVAVYTADAPSFTFRNAVGFLKFSISSNNVNRVVFKGCNSEQLTGNACVYIDGSGLMTDWNSTGGQTISVPVSSGKDCYLALMETEFTKGFHFSCYRSNGTLCGTVDTSKELQVKHGGIVNLGDLGSHMVSEPTGIEPFPYSEPFTNTKGDFTIKNVKLPSGSNYIWTTTDKYGMKASAYVNKNYASEGWLVSPFIDLTLAESAVLSFEHACNKFSGKKPENSLKVMASSDGENWSELQVQTWPAGTNWDFVNSGNTSLSKYLGGKVKIAFVYTSTTSVCGTWEVRNFSVKEGVGIETPDEGDKFYAQSEYGLYNFNSGVASITYLPQKHQLGVREHSSSKSFFIAYPKQSTYLMVTGLPKEPKEGDKANISITENFKNSYSGSFKATIGKVEDDKVWLYTSTGIGLIIKK